MLATLKKSPSPNKPSMNILIILPKLFLIISVILLMWMVILLSGVSILEFDPDWAGLSLSVWLIVISVLFGAFILIDMVMYVKPSVFAKGDIQEFIDTGSADDYLDGKKVYEYTFPSGKKGGIFSKTYVQIDENTLIRIRNQMIPAELLWPDESDENKKEEET
jgi:hypothetical protein